jgi:integrase
MRCGPACAARPPRQSGGADVGPAAPQTPRLIGTPIDPDSFSHTFVRMCKRAGLGHWHPHELRHSGASLMLAQGTPLHVVSEILGHASIAITKDVYGHLVEGEKRTAAESMSRTLLAVSSADGSQLGSQTAAESPATRAFDLARSEGLEPPTF